MSETIQVRYGKKDQKISTQRRKDAKDAKIFMLLVHRCLFGSTKHGCTFATSDEAPLAFIRFSFAPFASLRLCVEGFWGESFWGESLWSQA